MNNKEVKFEFDENTHTYKLNGTVIPSVTQILKAAGLISLEYVDKDILNQKADLGRKIHLTTELYDTDSLDDESTHSLLKSYLNQWIKFKSDYEVELDSIETMLYHPVYRYAGRIDRIGKVKMNNFKGKAIIDIKSGVPYHHHAIQLAGYADLYNYRKKTKDVITKRICVYLTPDDYKVIEHSSLTDRAIFFAALTINNYLTNRKERS